MTVIGLTGGIASGKSTIACFFAEHGAILVDADILARRALEQGSPTLARVVAFFGSSVLGDDGSLDRAALATIVFSNSEALRALNAIVHPEVRRLGAEAIRRAYAHNSQAIVVYDIPLLAETRERDEFDLVVVATASRALRRARLMKLRGLTAEEADARISAQTSDEHRESIADVIIDTSGTIDQTREHVNAVWTAITRDSVGGSI